MAHGKSTVVKAISGVQTVRRLLPAACLPVCLPDCLPARLLWGSNVLPVPLTINNLSTD